MNDKRERLKRALDWHVDIWCRRPMEWGIDDCGLSTANVIRSALGYDPAPQYRDKYDTREGAQLTLGKLGLAYAIKSVAKKHGWKRIDPREADVGDLGLVMMDGVPITVMCKAPGWFIGRGQIGAALLPVVNQANPSMSVRICWQL